MRGARCVRRRLRERALEARLYNVSVASSPPRRSFAPMPLASRRRASGGRARTNRPLETKPPTNRRRPLSHVVDDGRAETGETLGGVGHGDVRVHLLLRNGTSERRRGMAEVSVAPEAARKRQRIMCLGSTVGGGWRTAASSSSLRLREICTRMRRGTCGVDGTGGVSCSEIWENPRSFRRRGVPETRGSRRGRTLRMPLDQMCLLSLTSTRTSAVFMTLWANFFTCGREGAGKREGGEVSEITETREGAGRKPRPWAGERATPTARARAGAARDDSEPAGAPCGRSRRAVGPRGGVEGVGGTSKIIAAFALTADTARGARFLNVIPWTALARLMVYSRVTGSVDLPPMAAECEVVQLLRLPKRAPKPRGGPAY